MRMRTFFVVAAIAAVGVVATGIGQKHGNDTQQVHEDPQVPDSQPRGNPYHFLGRTESGMLSVTDLHRRGRYVYGVLYLDGVIYGPIGTTCEGLKVSIKAKLCELGLGLRNEER
jgi:hypothetical protein